MDKKKIVEQEKKENRIWCIGIALLIFEFVFFFVLVAFFHLNISAFVFWGIIFVSFILFFVVVGNIPDNTNVFKEEIVKKELAKYFDNLKYYYDFTEETEAELYINKKKFKAPHFNTVEEFFYGKYHDKRVSVYEVYYFNPSDDKHSGDFQGIWCTVDSSKEIKGSVYVCNNKFVDSNCLKDNINIEGIDFEKNYIITADDEEEAFYVLTPVVLEQIKKIEKIVGKDFCVIFESNKMHITIDGMYPFLDVDKLNNDYDGTIKELNNQIKKLTDVLDQIDSNDV